MPIRRGGRRRPEPEYFEKMDTEEKIEAKLAKRKEEKQKKDERERIAEDAVLEKSEREDELLRHNICPRCGEDTHPVFSLKASLYNFGITVRQFAKMKCPACGFNKIINLNEDGGNYY